MRNQSSRLRNATVAGGSGDPILRKSRPFWIFFFSPLHNTIHRRLLWNSPLIFIIFFPCTSNHLTIVVVVAAVVVVVVNEKTFNWGEKRENWKNYNDKGTRAERQRGKVSKKEVEGTGLCLYIEWRPTFPSPITGLRRGRVEAAWLCKDDKLYFFWKMAITIYTLARTKSQLLTIRRRACEWQKCYHRTWNCALEEIINVATKQCGKIKGYEKRSNNSPPPRRGRFKITAKDNPILSLIIYCSTTNV